MMNDKKLNVNRGYTDLTSPMHTAREISGQPKLWTEVFKLVGDQKEEIQEFLQPIIRNTNLRIILTGAGSSAFLGNTLQGGFQLETKRITQAIATTDLITHPEQFFLRKIPTLLVSFARSGNSPESLEAIREANQYCESIFHLIISCNRDGDIIKHGDKKNSYFLLLPPKSNDQALAMTGSFTSMLLAALLILRINRLDSVVHEFEMLKINAEDMINKHSYSIRRLAGEGYERVIFLGSGPLLGIARECQLKLQELTDGKVICKYDSFLGLRHGPRVVINEKSLIVYLFSNEENSFNYEKDLAKSISKSEPTYPAVCFGRKPADLKNCLLEISFSNSVSQLGIFYPVLAVMLGQIMGYYFSLDQGLDPDNPSVRGTINRVVQGVTIYTNEKDIE